MHISIQTEDFDPALVARDLQGDRRDIGAVVSFTGLVRDLTPGHELVALELEHYPGMTEKALGRIADEACGRWPIDDLAIIHRVGRLQPGAHIVLVVVLSAHRRAAFEACDFLMDYLKTRAPFWKKEITVDGESWIDARKSDEDDASRW